MEFQEKEVVSLSKIIFQYGVVGKYFSKVEWLHMVVKHAIRTKSEGYHVFRLPINKTLPR